VSEGRRGRDRGGVSLLLETLRCVESATLAAVVLAIDVHASAAP